MGFKINLIGVWPEIKLQNTSITPLSASEFLITGTLQEQLPIDLEEPCCLEREAVAGHWADALLLMCLVAFFNALRCSLIKCDLNTGYMRYMIWPHTSG